MVWESFKVRAQRQRGEFDDVYQYDDVPQPLRVQLVHVFEEVFLPLYNDRGSDTPVVSILEYARAEIRKQKGVFDLVGASYRSKNASDIWDELRSFLLVERDIEEFWSGVEFLCRIIDRPCRDAEVLQTADADKIATDALEEINQRIKMAKCGYSFIDGEIIRIDSELLHKEAVIPALAVLRLPHFKGAQHEFLEAHAAYRAGDKAKAIGECNKAFESVMKAVCEKRGWTVASTATAKTLVEVCLQNKLIPEFWQNHFTGLRTILESAIPTARNRKSGHGGGTTPTVIPDEMVPYVMHMTAATLLFLAEADARL